jgi:hypothetical protein
VAAKTSFKDRRSYIPNVTNPREIRMPPTLGFNKNCLPILASSVTQPRCRADLNAYPYTPYTQKERGYAKHRGGYSTFLEALHLRKVSDYAN